MHSISKREFTWKGIRHRERRRLWRAGAAGLLVMVILTVGVFVSGVVFANHNFSDVPTSAFYHNAVEWVFNRGITAGCAVGMYCPNDAVTRGTMAVFLRALGVALTPTYFESGGDSGGLDPDSNPVICQTADYSATGYPREALVFGEAVFNPAGNLGISMRNVASTDGGASWFVIGSINSGGSASTSGYFFSTSLHARIDLPVGTPFRFGIRVGRIFGTDDISGSSCAVHAVIVNRNSTSPPLSPRR